MSGPGGETRAGRLAAEEDRSIYSISSGTAERSVSLDYLPSELLEPFDIRLKLIVVVDQIVAIVSILGQQSAAIIASESVLCSVIDSTLLS